MQYVVQIVFKYYCYVKILLFKNNFARKLQMLSEMGTINSTKAQKAMRLHTQK
jgi:hypothetical protein